MLSVSIFRDRGFSDCSNGGLSSPERAPKGRAILIEENEEVPEQNPDFALPVFRVERRRFGNEVYVTAVPADPAEGKGLVGPMMGGNFLYTSDSRFRRTVCAYPIAIHDRFETQELYNRMCN